MGRLRLLALMRHRQYAAKVIFGPCRLVVGKGSSLLQAHWAVGLVRYSCGLAVAVAAWVPLTTNAGRGAAVAGGLVRLVPLMEQWWLLELARHPRRPQ